jgi:hypothetical protein
MKIADLQNKHDEIERLIKKLTDKNSERYPIYDGINNIEEYVSAKYKILFLLKEGYDETGGDFSISEVVSEGNYGKASKTFYPMIYITYAILNDFLLYDDMDYIQNDFENMNSYLYKVAHVNINKLPSLNGTRTDFRDIVSAYTKDKENDNIVLKQIQAYEPDIVIGCGLGELLTVDLGLYYDEITKGCLSDKYPNMLYIDTYHPAQTTISQEKYVNSIVGIVKSWAKLKN